MSKEKKLIIEYLDKKSFDNAAWCDSSFLLSTWVKRIEVKAKVFKNGNININEDDLPDDVAQVVSIHLHKDHWGK